MANRIDEFQISTSVILSNKERLTEQFIRQFLDQFETQYGSFNNLPADRSIQDHLALADVKLHECSILLGQRYSTVVKDFIRLAFEKHLNSKYGIIVVEMESDAILAEKYRICFNSFIYDDESIHFATNNKGLIHQIDMRHYFILMYYAFCTVKRQMGDNCLCLLAVGASTCGKTMIFESPAQEVSHNYTNETGVGRFMVQNKSILLLHDISMKVLTTAQDSEKLKCLARTESVNVKIHSSVHAMAPIFILGTSNQLLFNHSFPNPERRGNNLKRMYPANVTPTSKLVDADIKAIRNRYLEMFVRQQPFIPPDALPRCGSFKRIHLVVGLFTDILYLLNCYQKESFGSNYVYLYCIMALCKNLSLLPDTKQMELSPQIYNLFDHYRLTPYERSQMLSSINSTS